LYRAFFGFGFFKGGGVSSPSLRAKLLQLFFLVSFFLFFFPSFPVFFLFSLFRLRGRPSGDRFSVAVEKTVQLLAVVGLALFFSFSFDGGTPAVFLSRHPAGRYWEVLPSLSHLYVSFPCPLMTPSFFSLFGLFLLSLYLFQKIFDA